MKAVGLAPTAFFAFGYRIIHFRPRAEGRGASQLVSCERLELVGKDGLLVGLTVTIRIFEDQDLVVRQSVASWLMRDALHKGLAFHSESASALKKSGKDDAAGVGVR